MKNPNTNALWDENSETHEVSVIIPTYNRATYIRECLDSLLSQTIPAKEIIVIDDGSEDNTEEVLKSYCEKIKYIKKENEGKPATVNLGLSIASGNLIWIFDDDDVALPDAIESRIEILKQNPSAGFVYSPHYLGHDNSNGSIKRSELYTPPQHNENEFFFELMKGCFFHLASCLVRLEVYKEIGEFDSQLLSSEDYDIQIRLAHKFSAAYCPHPSFIFRQHEGPRGAKSIRYSGKKRAQTFKKYDQLVGKKIRTTIPLQSFLTSDQNPKNPNRTAILARMVVMASKGCISEMVEDLSLALRSIEKNERLSTPEISLIRSSVHTGYFFDALTDNWNIFKTGLQQLKNLPQYMEAKKAIAFGFFILAKSYPGTINERVNKLHYALKILFI